jgi:hypothetical protein
MKSCPLSPPLGRFDSESSSSSSIYWHSYGDLFRLAEIRLAGWFVSRLAGWFVSRLAGWFVSRLAGWFVARLAGWFVFSDLFRLAEISDRFRLAEIQSV